MFNLKIYFSILIFKKCKKYYNNIENHIFMSIFKNLKSFFKSNETVYI